MIDRGRLLSSPAPRPSAGAPWVARQTRFMRRLVLVFGALLSAGLALAAGAQQPIDTVQETTTVLAVEVPVTVVRKGRPVLGLGAGEFEVQVDGVATPVTGFESVELRTGGAGKSPGAAPVASAEPSEAGRRLLLLVFDLAFTTPRDAQKGVAAARTLLASSLDPSDRVAVGVYAETVGARLLSGFTLDRLRTQVALEALDLVIGGGGAKTVAAVRTLVQDAGERAGDGLRQFAADAPAYLRLQGAGQVVARSLAGEALDIIGDGGGGGGGRVPDLLAETLGDMESGFQRETRPLMVRNQSMRFLDTLGELGDALREIRGQRYFVLFSAGLEESLIAGLGQQVSGAGELERVLDRFARTGWEVHAVAVGAPQSAAGLGMGFLAKATGGHFYRNMQPQRALSRMIEQTSVAYVLTVQPEALGAPGTYHPIEVHLRDGRRAEVHHRAGFFTPAASALDPAALDALTVGSAVAELEDGGDFTVRMLAKAFKVHTPLGEQAQVPVVLEIDAADLPAPAANEPLQMLVEAYRMIPPTGSVSLFVQPLVLDPQHHARAFAAGGGVKLFASVSLPPGEHRLRVVVHDPAHQRRSVKTVSVFVPAFAEGGPQVLPPVFPETEKRWLYVNHAGGASSDDEDFPFHFKGRKFMPQVDPQIAAGGKLPVFLAAVALPDGGAGLRLVLEKSSGEAVPNDSLHIGGASERDAQGVLRVMAELDTSALAPGPYRLRLVWSDPEHGVVREAWQGFTVLEVAAAHGREKGPA